VTHTFKSKGLVMTKWRFISLISFGLLFLSSIPAPCADTSSRIALFQQELIFTEDSSTILAVEPHVNSERVLSFQINLTRSFYGISSLGNISMTIHFAHSTVSDIPLQVRLRWFTKGIRVGYMISTEYYSKKYNVWETHRMLNKFLLSSDNKIVFELDARDLGLINYQETAFWVTLEIPGHNIQTQPSTGFVSIKTI